jgi:hypothetical protein
LVRLQLATTCKDADLRHTIEHLFEYIPYSKVSDSASIKLTLHKTLIKSVMTYAGPASEFAADTHLLKLQLLKNKVLRTTGNFSKGHTGSRIAHGFPTSVRV